MGGWNSLLDSQLLGGTCAALICLALFGKTVVIAGTPQLATNLTVGQGILVEAILTFFLVFVVHATGVDARGRRVAGLAIGSTITLDIFFGGPLSGDESGTRVWSSISRQFLESALRLLAWAADRRRSRGVRLSPVHFGKDEQPGHRNGYLKAQRFERQRREKIFWVIDLQHRPRETGGEEAEVWRRGEAGLRLQL